jgi:hypothetical protein
MPLKTLARARPLKAPKPRKGPGRHTKLTPHREFVIMSMLSQGNTRRAACGAVHIDEDTFRVWMLKNPVFSGAVHGAEAIAEERWLRSALDEPGGHKWALSRRFSADWGDKLEVLNTGEQKLTIEVFERERADHPALPAPKAA